MFEPLNKLIKKNQRGNKELFLSTQICYEAKKVISALLPSLAGNFNIVSFSNKRLKIAADSVALHQIKMKETEIVDDLNKKIKIGRFKVVYAPKS